MIDNLLLLNGPPRSGKDTIGNVLCDHGWVRLSFARVLKDMTHRMYGVTCAHDRFEESKNKPCGAFYGKTPRQAYIAVSETLIKPLHGKQFFGERILDQLKPFDVSKSRYNIVITDCGFADEVRVVASKYRSTLVRVLRPSYSFQNDSRSYLSLADIAVDGTKMITLENSRDLAALTDKVRAVIDILQSDR
jgi:hypothetical protein